MSDLLGNHIVGFPARRLIYLMQNLITTIYVILPEESGNETNKKCRSIIYQLNK